MQPTPPVQVGGAALATALAEAFGCIIYLESLSRRVGGKRLQSTFWRRPPPKAALAALAAGAAARCGAETPDACRDDAVSNEAHPGCVRPCSSARSR